MIKRTMRSSAPRPVCRFEGKEMLLFWNNNTEHKIQQLKISPNYIIDTVYVCAHMYFILYSHVGVDVCDVSLCNLLKINVRKSDKCMFWMC